MNEAAEWMERIHGEIWTCPFPHRSHGRGRRTPSSSGLNRRPKRWAHGTISVSMNLSGTAASRPAPRPSPPPTNGCFTARAPDAAAGAGADPPQRSQPDGAGSHRPQEEAQDGLPRQRRRSRGGGAASPSWHEGKKGGLRALEGST